MLNEQAFIDTICANPHDDGPRLVYADWLEERGDKRGEFIRLQVEFEIGYKNEHLKDSGWLLDVQLSSDELLAAHCHEWTMMGLPERFKFWKSKLLDYTFFGVHLPVGPAWGAIRVHFRRGFPELLTCRWEEWAAHHETLRRAMPVTKVTMTTSCPAAIVKVLAAEWPGIEFVSMMPPLSEPEFGDLVLDAAVHLFG